MTTPEDIVRMEKDVINTLRGVYDPEIPVNIYDLGLIYEVEVEPGGTVTIRMTLTAPNCPMADQLLMQVNSDVKKIAGVEDVNVILTFDPPWDRSMISEEALLELGML
jgi:FeS assembly SUF system protein